jgi:hypothetical protein
LPTAIIIDPGVRDMMQQLSEGAVFFGCWRQAELFLS